MEDWQKALTTVFAVLIALGIAFVIKDNVLMPAVRSPPRGSYTLVESNYVKNYDAYTVHVKLRNDDDQVGTITVYCDVTIVDLSEMTKSQVARISIGETVVLDFVFTREELRDRTVKDYTIRIG